MSRCTSYRLFIPRQPALVQQFQHPGEHIVDQPIRHITLEDGLDLLLWWLIARNSLAPK